MLTQEQLEGVWDSIREAYSGEAALRELITTYFLPVLQERIQIYSRPEPFLDPKFAVGKVLEATRQIRPGFVEKASLFSVGGIPYVIITQAAPSLQNEVRRPTDDGFVVQGRSPQTA